ncbi:MAG: PAS domain-containing protein [Acidobacteriales bacterium]|nr:PAS domain-containing protein [Terriglobales bacterium]
MGLRQAIAGVKAVRKPMLHHGDAQQSADRALSGWALLRSAHYLAPALLVATGYYLGTSIGFAITPPQQPISTLWPPNAILFAALLLTAPRKWWILLLAVLPVHLWVQLSSGVPLMTALGRYCTNVGEGLLGATCVRIVNRGEPLFGRLRGVLNFILFGILLAPFVTTFLDAAVVVLTGWGTDYWHLWHMRLFSNMLANLMIVPAIVSLASLRPVSIKRVTLRTWIEFLCLAVAIGVVAVFIHTVESPEWSNVPVLIYLLLPLLLWAALRFGPSGVSVSMLATAFFSIWSAVHGHGPFISGPVSENVFSLQIFLGVIAVPLIAMAAILQERREVVQVLRKNEQWLKLDIEQRKIAEQYLVESRRRYEMATTAGGVAVWEWNLENNAVYFEPRLPTMLGYQSKDGQTHSDWLRLIHAEDRPRVEAALSALTPQNPNFDLEYRVRYKDGDLRWIHHQGTLYQQAGENRRVVGTLTDVTGSKLAVLALAESEQRFRQTADAAPMMVWMSAPEKGCTYVNRAWLDFTGRLLEAELGHGWVESVHPADKELCLKASQTNTHRRQPASIEYRLRRNDGEYRWILDHGVPRFDPKGEFIGFIGSSIDITDRKLSEQAAMDLSGKLIQAQEEERRRIARELHDDVGQRLALLSIELDKFRGKLSSTLRSRASQLWNQASDISQTVRDISHHLHSPGLEWLGLGAALKTLVEDFGQQHSIDVRFSENNVPVDVPENIKLAFYRVTQEALQNVTKHSGAHSVSLELNATTDKLKLQITDDGVGFAPEQHPASGLGIASMHERLRSIGGVMTITSARMQGTRLEALVPLQPQSHNLFNGAE